MHTMKNIKRATLPLILFTCSLSAQESSFQDPLLDRLAGTWVLQGTITGEETTHDIVAEWVLAHQYMRIHEVSREMEANGMPKYEAIVFIGWDEPSEQYACLWLDVTGGGGLTGEAIGHAKRSGDELPFLFKVSDVYLIHTTFAYNRSSDTWQWNIDNERGGKHKPFARVTLQRN
jgi:hypothetical protein